MNAIALSPQMWVPLVIIAGGALGWVFVTLIIEAIETLRNME